MLCLVLPDVEIDQPLGQSLVVLRKVGDGNAAGVDVEADAVAGHHIGEGRFFLIAVDADCRVQDVLDLIPFQILYDVAKAPCSRLQVVL